MNKKQQAERKAIAWSTDALIPGFYVWLENWSFRFGGTEAEESYPGTIHSKFGVWSGDRVTWLPHLVYVPGIV